MSTRTYPDLLSDLQNLRLSSVGSSLEFAVREEQEALLRGSDAKRTAKAIRVAEDDAKESYAAQISAFLDAPGSQLTPDQILNSRIIPAAWAIAQEMLAARQGRCPECGEMLTKATNPIALYNGELWLAVNVFVCCGPQQHNCFVQTGVITQ
jgi:hypothetical protein